MEHFLKVFYFCVQVDGVVMMRASVGPAKTVVLPLLLPSGDSPMARSFKLLRLHDCAEPLNPEVASACSYFTPEVNAGVSASAAQGSEDVAQHSQKRSQAAFSLRQPPTIPFEACRYTVRFCFMGSARSPRTQMPALQHFIHQ